MRISRRSDIDPFIVMDVMDNARRAEELGRHIIHMEVGQPGTPAPEGARRALAGAMERDAMGYTVALGLPALRRGIADLYGRWYDIDLDPARIIVTSGASGAFILAFTALFDVGDRVAIGEPGYPSYRQNLRALDLIPVGIETSANDRYQPRPEQIPGGLQGLIVASPGNPTGTMLKGKELGELIDHAATRDISFISDEIYHGLQFGEPAKSALSFSNDVYVINSFSKYFSMTGWRVGWMVVPQDHVRVVERIAQNLFICPPHASQIAALAALECHDELQEIVQVYADNRKIVVDGLQAAGLNKFVPPDGAFYVYVDVSDITNDALALADDLLASAGIAVTPGLDFDTRRGHHTIRISFAGPSADIEEGMSRLKDFMACRARR